MIGLLTSAFEPVYEFLLALMVNARHLFYGISMLGRFQGMGWKKWLLVFGLTDETFSIHCAAKEPAGWTGDGLCCAFRCWITATGCWAR